MVDMTQWARVKLYYPQKNIESDYGVVYRNCKEGTIISRELHLWASKDDKLCNKRYQGSQRASNGHSIWALKRQNKIQRSFYTMCATTSDFMWWRITQTCPDFCWFRTHLRSPFVRGRLWGSSFLPQTPQVLVGTTPNRRGQNVVSIYWRDFALWESLTKNFVQEKAGRPAELRPWRSCEACWLRKPWLMTVWVGRSKGRGWKHRVGHCSREGGTLAPLSNSLFAHPVGW